MSRGLDALRARLYSGDASPDALIRILTDLGYVETQRVNGDVLMSTDRFAVWVPVSDTPDNDLLESAREFVAEQVRKHLYPDAVTMMSALDHIDLLARRIRRQYPEVAKHLSEILDDL